MKTRRLLAYATFPAAALLLFAASCNLTIPPTPTWSLPQPVSIAGGKDWGNLFPFWSLWQSSSDEGGRAGLLLRDGDIFGDKAMTVYRTTDGPTLELTSTDWSIQKAGRVIGISLESGDEGREWLATASDQDLAGVRCLTLPEQFDASSLLVLKRLAAANPGVALFVPSGAALQQVLPLFRPEVLGINYGAQDADVRNLLADQQQITTVVISGEKAGSLEPLRRLQNLRRLAILNWKVETAGALPAGLDRLESLGVFGSSMTDLSALDAAPAGLQELSLQADDLVDIRALAQRPGLKALLLGAEKKLAGLPELAGLSQLQWVSLPPETTQEQFAAFVVAHRNLRILQLLGCEKVTDLAPVRDLKELEGLVIMGSEAKLDALRDLKTLHFVGLDQKLFQESPEEIAAIRQALPDALVVSVSGFCLGSGWILLLVPAIVGLRFMGRCRLAAGDARHA